MPFLWLHLLPHIINCLVLSIPRVARPRVCLAEVLPQNLDLLTFDASAQGRIDRLHSMVIGKHLHMPLMFIVALGCATSETTLDSARGGHSITRSVTSTVR
jgi:hypothetical protein